MLALGINLAKVSVELIQTTPGGKHLPPMLSETPRMPGHNSISSLLSPAPRGDAPRNPSARQGGEDFRRLLESPPRNESPLRNEGPAQNDRSAQNQRPARQEPPLRAESPGQNRASERSELAQRRDAAREQNQARVDAKASADRKQADRAESKKSETTASTDRPRVDDQPARAASASAGKTDRTEQSGTSGEAQESTPTAEELLAQLSQGDLEALGNDVAGLLKDLHAQLEAGQLSEDAEAALKELMVALEEGAPVADIENLLQAIPIAEIPALAQRFPEGKNLKDVLGGSGAAYLSQLAKEAGGRATESGSQFKVGGASLDSSSSLLAGGMQTADPDDMLEKLLGGKDPELSAGKEAFAKLLQAAGRGENPGARPIELVQNTTAASSLANLDAARQAPVQPGERQFTVQSEVRVPVGQAQWSQAVGQRVLWQAAQNISTAELRLDPPDLGPMQVRVSSHQDQISVTFTSAQPAVREALDQSAARLREMFADQGLDLVDVNVSDQSDRGQAGEGEGDGSGRGRQHAGAGDEPDAGVVTETLVSQYLVDHYA